MEYALKVWTDQGGTVLHVIHTVPHYHHQHLGVVLNGFSKAREFMHHRKPFKKLAKQIGLAGTVRALEVEYGENGWHVHDHELFFILPGVHPDPRETQDSILAIWQDACASAGLDRPNYRGVKVQDGSQANKYASKWGLDRELTKAHLKRSKGELISPWDMLWLIGQGEGDYIEVFREYAKEFKGRRQLVWSKGRVDGLRIRERLGLGEESTDEEIAALIEPDAELLAALSLRQWNMVLSRELRGELLEVASKLGREGVKNFIRQLLKEQV